MEPQSPSRRRWLQGGLAASSLFLPVPHALVWAQSDGALRLVRLPKIALVIGNSAYARVPPLANPGNDARGIGEALRAAGFTVDLRLDATRPEMMGAIDAYAKALATKKCVGLFYFAGHGLQVAWRNYLVPVDASIARVEDIPANGIDVNGLVEGIKRAANPMNVIILDACRENPFAAEFRAEQKGLSQMDAPSGTLLAYATAPGNLASDGDGANGLYTGNLLREMRVPEAKIEDVFKRVRLGVRRASKGAQVPWESTSLEEDFYFLPPEQLKKLSEEEERRQFAAERAMFERARDSRAAPALEEYLHRYPSGRYAELAQLNLDRALAAQGQRAVEPAPSEGNPNTVGSARADTGFRVGDRYAYRVTDRRTGEVRDRVQTVTAVTDQEVVFNGGRLVMDLLGNVLLAPDGRRFSPRQDIPLEFAVGKRWTSRFELLGGGGVGPGSVELQFRIVARERITVPAGSFDCFRVEGHGYNTYVFRDPVEIDVTVWRAPRQVRRAIATQEARSTRGSIVYSDRHELVSFRQS